MSDDFEWTLNTCLSDIDYFIDRFKKRASGPQGERFSPPLQRLAQLRSKIEYLIDNSSEQSGSETFSGVLPNSSDRGSVDPHSAQQMNRDELSLRFNKLNLTVTALLEKLSLLPNSFEHGMGDLGTQLKSLDERIDAMCTQINKLKFSIEKTGDDLSDNRRELREIRTNFDLLAEQSLDSKSLENLRESLLQVIQSIEEKQGQQNAMLVEVAQAVSDFKPAAVSPSEQVLNQISQQLATLIHNDQVREQRLQFVEEQNSVLREYLNKVGTVNSKLPLSVVTANPDEKIALPKSRQIFESNSESTNSSETKTSAPEAENIKREREQEDQLTAAFSTSQSFARPAVDLIALTPDEQETLDELQALTAQEQQDLVNSVQQDLGEGQEIIEGHEPLDIVDQASQEQLTRSASDFTFTLDDIDI